MIIIIVYFANLASDCTSVELSCGDDRRLAENTTNKHKLLNNKLNNKYTKSITNSIN